VWEKRVKDKPAPRVGIRGTRADATVGWTVDRMSTVCSRQDTPRTSSYAAFGERFP
jgi:hypothetical protein